MGIISKKIEQVFKEQDVFFKIELILNIECVVGYIKDHTFFGRAEIITFIIIAETNENVTEEFIQQFSEAGFKYGKENYDGKGIGNNSGLVTISVLIASDIEQGAKKFCKRAQKPQWASRKFSMIYDNKQHEFFPSYGIQFWGFLIFPYYKKMLNYTIDCIKKAIRK